MKVVISNFIPHLVDCAGNPRIPHIPVANGHSWNFHDILSHSDYTLTIHLYVLCLLYFTRKIWKTAYDASAVWSFNQMLIEARWSNSFTRVKINKIAKFSLDFKQKLGREGHIPEARNPFRKFVPQAGIQRNFVGFCFDLELSPSSNHWRPIKFKNINKTIVPVTDEVLNSYSQLFFAW